MVTLALAKQHTRTTHTDEDALIQQYIDAALAWVESYTGKRMSIGAVTQTERGFGGYIKLSRGPFVSLTSVSYTDTDSVVQTLAGSRTVTGRVYPPIAGWPAAADYTPLTVVYQAGFATTPADLVSAQLLLIGHWFANREAVNVGNTATEIPMAVESLCRPYRELLV